MINKISANIVDIISRKIFPGTVFIRNGIIKDIVQDDKKYGTFIIPGLIDAHIHIESSLLIPSEFARLSVVHGTVATVSDPHEIANVLGTLGIAFMIKNARKVPFKVYFGAPSCVPATTFETAGSRICLNTIDKLLRRKEIKYLSEMMNYPGVINQDVNEMAKIEIAKRHNKPVDGHAPEIMGEELKKYIQAGISTDHETSHYEQGLEKLKLGMKIMIREGSAAKNFSALHRLIGEYPGSVMFASDDKHPDELVKGHINLLVKESLRLGYDKMDVLRCASYNPVKHYGLDVGLLQKGDPADFVVIDNFGDFNILKTVINGSLAAENGKSLIKKVPEKPVNNFRAKAKKPSDFSVKAGEGLMNVIEAADGELITKRLKLTPKIDKGYIVSDTDRDILKICVVNRYEEAAPAVAFIKNFGLKKGAIAISVAHDSHNIVAVGVTDEDIAKAVNLIVKHSGGIALVDKNIKEILPLPVAGIMTNQDGYKSAEKYSRINAMVGKLGSCLKDPYMTLSFMALLVEPEIKLSDKGLFDGVNFKFISLLDPLS